MSHLPLSLMNILNKTESAVSKVWILYFHDLFSDYLSNGLLSQPNDRNFKYASLVSVIH